MIVINAAFILKTAGKLVTLFPILVSTKIMTELSAKINTFCSFHNAEERNYRKSVEWHVELSKM